VNATTTDSLQRIPDQKSRMREIRTYGSVGTPGGQPPGVTRQSSRDACWRSRAGRVSRVEVNGETRSRPTAGERERVLSSKRRVDVALDGKRPLGLGRLRGLLAAVRLLYSTAGVRAGERDL
jgi:hypothetical protein